MDASPEPTPELNELNSQAGQAKSAADEPTIQDIRSWDTKTLLPWIQKKLSAPLELTDAEKFLNIGIDGAVFIGGAGNMGFFERAGLPFSPSFKLAELAGEITGSKSEAQKLTLGEALAKEGLAKKAQGDLSVLTKEERINTLRHIGTKPLPNRQYSRLLSVIENLSPGWNPKENIPPSEDDKTFTFPITDQRALFVRKCYHELYDIIVKSPITATKPHRILLTGTPGIGKSTFLIYFIVRHLYESIIAPNSKENPVISSSGMRDILIFQPAQSSNEFYAFASPNIVRTGTYSDFEAFFLLPTTWYLVDWRPKSKPESENAATLFALSPNSISDPEFKDFEKVLTHRLCMPVWTYNELEECRRHAFPELSAESLEYIYSRVGGVPRYCLELPTEALRRGRSVEQAHKAGLERLEGAFKKVKHPLDVLRTQEENLDSVKVSGRLLHMVPDLEYQDSWRRVWASAYVIDRFVDMINTESASAMYREVRDGLARNERDGTLGKIFECYVRHLFFTGSETKIRKRRLHKAPNKRKKSEAEERFAIPKKLEHKPFNGMADFSIPVGDTRTIWTPGPNFPSVDMVLTPNSLFQITISQRHPVKQEPLKKILQKLPAKKNISLYFIVPDDNFETFPYQKYQTEQGKVSRKVPKAIENIEQWVLGVQLKKKLKKENAEQPEVQGTRERTAGEDDVRQPRRSKRKRTERKKELSKENAEQPEVQGVRERTASEDDVQQLRRSKRKKTEKEKTE